MSLIKLFTYLKPALYQRAAQHGSDYSS